MDIYIYISVSSTNPGTFLGGTWQAFGKGTMLVGVDTSNSKFNAANKTGGQFEQYLDDSVMPSYITMYDKEEYPGGQPGNYLAKVTYSNPPDGGNYAIVGKWGCRFYRKDNEGDDPSNPTLSGYIGPLDITNKYTTVYMFRRVS